MEIIGSKRSYALTWCMPNNDDDDDLYCVTFVRDSQSHKSQAQGHKFTFTTRSTYLQLTQIGRRYTVTCIVFDAPSQSNLRENPHIISGNNHRHTFCP